MRTACANPPIRLHKTMPERSKIGITRKQRTAGSNLTRDFTRNDYLGLAQHPALIDAAQQALVQGVGSAGSPLVCGYSEAHRQCEQAFAQWLGFERALLVSNGYLANHIALQALCSKQTTVIADKHIHASVIDACHTYQVTLKRYIHQDLQALERRLQTTPGKKLVMVEGIFSLYGTQTDLAALVHLCQQYQAQLVVDDAHGIGILADGRGSLAAAGLRPYQVTLLCCPLGKAFGTYGAMLLGSAAVIESIVQHSRIYRYSTALPQHIAAINYAALQLVQQAAVQRNRLADNIAYLRACALNHELDIGPSYSAIQPIYFKHMTAATACQLTLQKQGLNTYIMTPPTVPAHRCLMRLTLSSSHHNQVINELIGAIAHHA